MASVKSESDLHRVGAVAGRTVIDHFDVVAVRIEHKGAVVARVVGAFAGRAVVGAAGGDRGAVEGIDGGAVAGLEGQVVAAGQLAGGGLAAGAG
ncbi:hypothetical protein G6F62_015865 [Rhizopus arrhizus]|nr:hypothetical protein G6F62_015865 [Rhizopus arrhizus]